MLSLGLLSVLKYNVRKNIFFDFIVSAIITIFLIKGYAFLRDTLFIIKILLFGKVVLKFDVLLPVNNLFIKLNESRFRRIMFFRNFASVFYFFIMFLVDFIILSRFGLIQSVPNFWLISIVFLLQAWIVSYIFQHSKIWYNREYELNSLIQFISLVVFLLLLHVGLHLINPDAILLVVGLLAISQSVLLYFLHNSLSTFKAYRRPDD